MRRRASRKLEKIGKSILIGISRGAAGRLYGELGRRKSGVTPGIEGRIAQTNNRGGKAEDRRHRGTFREGDDDGLVTFRKEICARRERKRYGRFPRRDDD